MTRLTGRGVSPGPGAGIVEGEVLVSSADLPLSGVTFELATGRIVWPDHPLSGESVRDRILVLPGVKAFAGGDWALYAMSTLHASGPRAIVSGGTDPFATAGCLLGDIPLIDSVPPEELARIPAGARLRVDAARGEVSVIAPGTEASRGRTTRRSRTRTPPLPQLDEVDERILEGGEGEAARECLELLIRFAGAVGARRMTPVQSVHVAGSGYNTTGDATLAFLERLASRRRHARGCLRH